MILHLTPDQIMKLDEYEGEHYDRIRVELEKGHMAWTYVWNGTDNT